MIDCSLSSEIEASAACGRGASQPGRATFLRSQL